MFTGSVRGVVDMEAAAAFPTFNYVYLVRQTLYYVFINDMVADCCLKTHYRLLYEVMKNGRLCPHKEVAIMLELNFHGKKLRKTPK